jgi:hypothetical protein
MGAHRPFAALAVFAATACPTSGTDDPCADVDCSQRGICLADQGTAYCACLSGYHPAGLQCLPNDAADPCAGVDCSGHGDCFVRGGLPECACDEGYRHPADTGLLCFPVGDAAPDADAGAEAEGEDGREGEAGADGEARDEAAPESDDGGPDDGGPDDGGPDDAGCPAGLAECDGNPATVCETALGTRENCAGCGDACAAPPAVWCLDGACSARFYPVDVPEYVMAPSPGWQLCQADRSCCHDGYEDVDGEWLFGTSCTSGVYTRDYLRMDSNEPWLFGLHKNSEAENFRCFANPDRPCSTDVDFPPHAAPHYTTPPVLPATAVDPGRVTPGAIPILEFGGTWRPFDVRGFRASDCGDLGFAGRIWQRNWVFVVDALDLGGDVGVVSDVYVLETETAGVEPGADWRGGERLERYWFAAGWGRVRQGGADDAACRASRDAAHCDGVYAPETDTVFNTRVPGDYTIPPVCRDY